MKKMRILQVNKLYAPVIGGVEKVVQQVAEGLQGRVDMEVLVCQKKGRTTVEEINGVRIYRASSLGMFCSTPISLSFFLKFRSLVSKADIVHIHMPFPLADVALLFSGYRGKVVLWWHSDIVRQKKMMRLYRPFMIWLLNRADRIIAATEGHVIGSPYLSKYREKCSIIPFGVDPKLLLESDCYFSRQKQVNPKTKILFVGRLVYYKGCEVLLNAFAKVAGAELVLAGDGPLKNQLLQQTKDLGITSHVRFLGYIDDQALGEQLAGCDFLVLPSIARTEAFGLVQIEAMAYGKPVINTALSSGVPYVSIDGESGLTVTPGDAGELARAMQRLIDDRALRDRMGRAAYQRAREVYSMKRMLDSVYEVYENLLEGDEHGQPTGI